ncbi:hypothetical protein C7446_2585 [Kushneria sinocarnis]|uniref:Uncharacterized protein n=1 Tax=Kushneria sinocarnis TaxID=595502 RepID=A0A420WUP1_9GAMM|nr:hypothetical protein [Kushneria sinocarnis]RKQ97165.1 hypothetical protein C7446_2585 [Kushneria sinocarnis]
MKIIYIPQRSDLSAEYELGDDKVIAHMNGHQETFNFQNMPDGRADSITADYLPICPVVAAERVDGDLTVTLLHWYGVDAAEDEKQEREVTV